MLLCQRFIPGLAIASFVVGDEQSGDAVVIDPVRDVDDYLEYADKHHLRIRHILETHVHADYVCGSNELIHRLDGEVSIHCSGEGGAEWIPPYADPVVHHGDQFEIGKLRFEAWHTPGHTPEHCCWALFDDNRSKELPWLIFTGDFLFVGDVGRPDLLGEEERTVLAHDLFESVFVRAKSWPDFTEIFPGHGSGSLCGKAIGSRRSSTVGYERKFSRAFHEIDEDEWVRALLADMPAAPPYFKKMKRVNRQGPAVLGTPRPHPMRLGTHEINDLVDSDHLVLDVRSKEAFAAAHIPNSISIPLAATLPSWAGWVIPYDEPLVIVADDSSDVASATLHLQRIGLDHVVGCLDTGIDAWQNQARPLASFAMNTPAELSRQLKSQGTSPFVLDVRSDGEWNQGHIDGAVHIHAGMLVNRLDELDKDQPVQVICGSGYRGSIAASILCRAGFERVSNVLGGMAAWKAAGLGVTTDFPRAARITA